MPDSTEVTELKNQLAEAQEQLAAQEVLRKKGVFFKVSAKGAVSVFGLARRPITLYANQWHAILIELSGPLSQFIAMNYAELAKK